MKSINCLGGVQSVLHFSESERLLGFFDKYLRLIVKTRVSERAKFTSLF